MYLHVSRWHILPCLSSYLLYLCFLYFCHRIFDRFSTFLFISKRASPGYTEEADIARCPWDPDPAPPQPLRRDARGHLACPLCYSALTLG